MASIPRPQRLSVSFSSLPKHAERPSRATILRTLGSAVSNPEMAPGTVPDLSDRPLSAIGKIKARRGRVAPPLPLAPLAVTWGHTSLAPQQSPGPHTPRPPPTASRCSRRRR